MPNSTDRTEIESLIFINDRLEGVPTGGLHLPSSVAFYSYRWGRRDIERGAIGALVNHITITPATVGEEGLQHFESMSSAVLHGAESGGLPVIVVRLGDDLSSPLLRVEQADYPGYLNSLAFASQLTGIPFSELAENGDVQEDHEPIGYKIRMLRRLRRRGQGGAPAATILEVEIGEGYRHRHTRNVT